MSLVYFGLPLGAVALACDGLVPSIACISRTDLPGMHRLRALAARGRTLLLVRPDLEQPDVQSLVEDARPSLFVSWFWTRRIPERVLGMAPFGFNVHPSLLPRHRGPDPYFWTLRRGETVTGVTAHRLTPEYDAGPVLAQVPMEVPPDVDAWQLARRLDRPSLRLMRDLARRASQGEALSEIEQDPSAVTAAPQPTDDDCEIRWTGSTEEVLRTIRAAAPLPGAYTAYGDETKVIVRARAALEPPAILDPGEIARTREGLVIRTGDGAVVVLEARDELSDSTVRGDALLHLFPGVPDLTRRA